MEGIRIADRPEAAIWKDPGAGEHKNLAGSCLAGSCLIDESPHGTHKLASAAGSGHRGRILIVDDDRFVLETLADLLEVVGFCPVQASDAMEALLILRKDPTIVALLTDLTMPGADGITLISQAREIRCGLPAILLTGYAEEVTSVTTCAGGNFHVLRKPAESECLIEQLELLVTRSPSV